MADFDLAMAALFEAEKGLADVPGDSGGITKYGISLKFLQGLGLREGDLTGDGIIDRKDILALEPDKAAALFQKYFWEPMQLGAVDAQEVAEKIYLMAANSWTSVATTIAQRALNDLGVSVAVDGHMGPRTLEGLNTVSPESFIASFQQHAREFYRAVVRAHPHMQKFLAGWFNRLMG